MSSLQGRGKANRSDTVTPARPLSMSSGAGVFLLACRMEEDRMDGAGADEESCGKDENDIDRGEGVEGAEEARLDVGFRDDIFTRRVVDVGSKGNANASPFAMESEDADEMRMSSITCDSVWYKGYYGRKVLNLM